MGVTPGDRLGPYEITAKLGEGGMGEVYRATDTRLKREVAIKVLPPEVAADPDRLARFQREAEVLASLNHPNIAGIYGLEDSGPTKALVLELVEGPTLAEIIAGETRGAPAAVATSGAEEQRARGAPRALSTDEVLPIARQIAEALEAAHDAGVIHRDLKPANIKLRPDGTVKVLDFGLAKALAPALGGSTAASQSPTLTTPAQTMQGTILGTAAYMSPEQARGKPVDKRADIWAFGAVLFEMLAGRRAFPGDDVTDTLAAVVRGEPEWSLLPHTLSPTLRVFLQHCLDKDPRNRVGDMRDVRLAIVGAFDPPPVASTSGAGVPAMATVPTWRRVLPLAATAVIAGAAAGFLGRLWVPADPHPVIRATYVLPPLRSLNIVTSQIVDIAPGGERFAYLAPGQEGALHVREIDALEDKPLMVDVGAVSPFFAPDGRSLGYLDTGRYEIKQVSITGGPSRVLTATGKATFTSGMTWEADGSLLYGIDTGIWRVSEDGGDPEQLVELEPGEAIYGPRLLPGGEWLLFALSRSSSPNRWDEADVVAQSIESGERRVLVSGGSDARYVSTGHLIYANGNTLYAAPFDLDRLAATGSPVPVVEDVGRPGDNSGGAFYSVSRTGTLVYVPGVGASGRGVLTWVEVLDGRRTPLELPEGAHSHPRISPDGRWLAFESQQGFRTDVWIYELSGTTAMRRLTEGGNNRYPVWSRDGTYVVFQSDREGDRGLFWQRADGTGPVERLTTPEPNTYHVPEDWSPTDDRLAFSVQRDNGVELWQWNQADRSSERFGGEPAVASAGLMNAAFSPDGQWLAYTLRGGAAGVSLYVASVSAPNTRFQVGQATDVNHHPLWAPNGARLYFFSVTTPMAVGITTEPRFGIGRPAPLSGLALNVSPQTELNHDITPDGSRFLTVAPADAEAETQDQQIVTVYNWFEELKRLVPTE